MEIDQTMKSKAFFKSTIGAITCVFLMSHATNAQPILLDDTYTIEVLVNEILVGMGVTASNITHNNMPGSTVSLHNGYFNAVGGNFLIEEGMVMATTNINFVGGNPPFQTENFTNDPDLIAMAGINVNNCSVIEFDFIANADSITLNYIFASEEYQNYTCTAFNDPFGFFISGPGISGPYTSPDAFPDGSVNIALIPNSDVAVGINTVNSGTVPSTSSNYQICLEANPNFVEDSQYFVQNLPLDPNSIQITGHTVKLVAGASVQCGETYHLKIAIGNAADASMQSAIFLEKGSLMVAGAVDETTISLCADLGTVDLNDFVEIATGDELIWYNTQGDTISNQVDVSIAPGEILEFSYAALGDTICVLPKKLILSVDQQSGVEECTSSHEVCDFSGPVVLMELLPCIPDFQGEWLAPDGNAYTSPTVNDISPTGTYQYVVENTCGQWIYEVEINNALETLINTHPADQAVAPGSTALFHIFGAFSNLDLQWQLDSGEGFENLSNEGQHYGVNNPTLLVFIVNQANDGQVYRCLIADGDCNFASQTATLSIDLSLSAADAGANSSLSVFPNPVGDQFSISAGSDLLGARFHVSDLSGKIVYADLIRSPQQTVSATGLGAGMYFLIIDSPQRQVRKLVKATQ